MNVATSSVTQAIAAHLNSDRLEEAETLLRHAAPESDPVAIKQRAALALKRGLTDEAEAHVAEALAVNERDAEAYTLLSAIHARRDDSAAARECAERASAIAPDDTRIAMNLALARHAHGEQEEALTRLSELAAAEPGDADLAYNLGTLVLAANRPRTAVPHLRRVTQLDPERVDGWANLATALQTLGELAVALDAAERALLLDPLNPTVMTIKAGVLSDAGKQTEAIALTERAVKLRPGAGHVLLIQATALARDAQWERAAATLAPVVRAAPGHPAALFLLGHALARQNKIEPALACFRHIGSDVPTAVKLQAKLLLQLGRSGEAFEQWAAAGELPDSVAGVDTLEGVERLVVVVDVEPTVAILLLRYIAPLAARSIEVCVAGNALVAVLAARVRGVGSILGPSDEVPRDWPFVRIERLPHLIAQLDRQAHTAPLSVGRYVAAATQGRDAEHPHTGARGLRIGVCTEVTDDDYAPRAWCAPNDTELKRSLAPVAGEVVDITLHVSPQRLMERLCDVDVLVSVDNEAAHLAAAMGIGVVVLLRAGDGWAWPRTVKRSPWYPHTRAVVASAEGGQWSPDHIVEAVRALCPTPPTDSVRDPGQ